MAQCVQPRRHGDGAEPLCKRSKCTGRKIHGWDELSAWYAPWREKLESQPGFGYEYNEVLPGSDSAAAVIELWTDSRRWTQIGTTTCGGAR
jgi:hypothetical protein